MFQFLKKSKKSVSPSAGYTSSMPVSTDSSNQNDKPQYLGNADKIHWPKIEFAFRSGNKNYFCWNQDIMISWERMEAAKMIYRELDYQMNPTMLTQHWEAIESLLTDPKKKVEKKMLEIGVLNESMKQAQNLSIRLDTQIKLATVKYFDEYEDPFGYDHKYNLEKVKFWSSNNDISTFFLNLPQNQYLQPSEGLQENFQSCLKGIAVMNIKNMELHSTLMNSENLSQDIKKELDLQKEWMLAMSHWSDVPITSFI
jgi:hypothetical protein